MTTLATPDEVELELAPGFASRTFSAAITPGDGRTVDLRIVPYGERIVHNDGLGGLPRGIEYVEEMAPGVFDHMIPVPHKVLMDVEHEEGIAGIVGRGLTLASRTDGFHGSFRILKTQAGDTALELVREGVLAGASVECLFDKSIRAADGVVRRIKATLNKVALCREPAYKGAVVLGLRTHSPVIVDEELLPIPFNPELAERISALGITIPDRLLALPATETPAEAGAPERTPAIGENE